ncbi:hypothetical protein CCO02nite_24750 [Cellulomonas composti]|uniref:Uncharacterized protein n=1 Tax=Cellulomonas composti TaxID=266130 RepID=A0A511JCT7_9CELL|nr:hypothetical protein CCO02nite_24750 [Cellulomonas composti]
MRTSRATTPPGTSWYGLSSTTKFMSTLAQGDGYALQVRAYADAGSSPLKIDNVRIGVVP